MGVDLRVRLRRDKISVRAPTKVLHSRSTAWGCTTFTNNPERYADEATVFKDPDANLAELSINAREMTQGGSSMEETLAALRKQGATVMQTITVVRRLTGMSLREAKDLIHNSAMWNDIGPASAASHARLLREVDKTAEHVSAEGREYLRVRLPDELD